MMHPWANRVMDEREMVRTVALPVIHQNWRVNDEVPCEVDIDLGVLYV